MFLAMYMEQAKSVAQIVVSQKKKHLMIASASYRWSFANF